MKFEIESYSALLLVGGDGTIHEGLNGLMRREDKKRIPVGLIPNGSGDDACGCLSLQVNDTLSALNYVLKGDVIKVDIIKMLIDYNSEEELLECVKSDSNFKIEDHLRYSFINSNLCVSANIAKNAASMKPRFG
jgi:diacylglycerol kinase family enzyme